MRTSSIKNLTSCTTFTHSTSILTPSSSVFVTCDSTDSLVPFSRASRSQTGLTQRSRALLSGMHTPDKLGTTPCRICALNGLLLPSSVSVKSPTSSSGSDSSNTVVDTEVASSTMRFLNLMVSNLGGDMAVTYSPLPMIRPSNTADFTLSPTPIKMKTSISVLTPPPQRVVLPSKLNGTLFAS